MAEKKKLRDLPSVNALLDHPVIAELIDKHGRNVVTYAARRTIDGARARILDGQQASSTEDIISEVVELLEAISGKSLKPVINATGVALHTNFGRAPLGQAIVNDIVEIAGGYSSLEYNLKKACRGNRNVHIVEILKFLTAAEDAIVVNNNAAAIILVLNILAQNREVIISRGELIEIGGSFRIPEIMEAGGARMIEVGTTNRTRLSDYEEAIGPQTALIFKAHKSNYFMKGFTEEVSVKQLADLARTHGLPMVYDIGSGLLYKPEGLPLHDEPDVCAAIADGADLVTFSCDKLLGGPQAGIVAGRGDLVSRLAQAPLMRALRVGKLTLAALSSACRQYLHNENPLTLNPVFAMLGRNRQELERLASKLLDELKRSNIAARMVESTGQCGGGSLPDVRFPSVAVEILPQSEIGDRKMTFAERLFNRLLNIDRPISGVLREGKILFDVLTVFEKDIPHIACSISEAIKAEAER